MTQGEGGGTLLRMNRRWSCAAVLAVLTCWTASARAEGTGEATRSSNPRRYSERVSWHTTPNGLELPAAPDSGDKGSDTDFLHPHTTPPVSATDIEPATPTRPRDAGAPEKAPKSKNWILPPPIEGQTAPKGDEEEKTDSGWGWLADDVRDRTQQKADADQRKKQEEEEEDATAAQTSDDSSAKKGDEDKASSPGLLLDNTFEPVPTSDLLEESGRRDIMDMISTDEGEAREKAALKKDAETPPRNEPLKPDLPSLTDQKFSGDSKWGNERMWTPDGTPNSQGALPQTAALLSGIAKPAPAGAALSLPSKVEQPASRSGLLTTPSGLGSDRPAGLGASGLPGAAPGAKSMFTPDRALLTPQPVSSAFDPTPLLRRNGAYRPLNAASPSAPLSSGSSSWPLESR